MSKKRTILIADDEYGFRFPCRMYLRSRGFNVEEASNNKEVFERISDADLLMMDVIFPDNREGIEIVKKIRKSGDENIENISVICFSILSESACAKESLEDAEPYIWLQKPFEFETLLTKIKELMRI